MPAPLTPPNDPKDTKNLLVAIALSLLVIFAWQALVEGPKREREATAREARLAAETVSPTPGGDDPVGASGSVVVAEVKPRDEVLAQSAGERVTISSGALHGSLLLQGARFDDLTLVRYRESVEADSPEIKLLSPSGTELPYYAEFGWSGQGLVLPNASSVWTASARELTPDSPVTLTWDNGHGLVFERKITLDEHFMFTVEQTVRNTTGEAVALRPYGLVLREVSKETFEKGSFDFFGALGVFSNELERATFKELAKKGMVKAESTGGWLGFTDKYWLVALAPAPSERIDARMMHASKVNEMRFQTDYAGAVMTIPAGGQSSATTYFFAGAKEVRVLDGYADTLGIAHFDLAIDFGLLYFLTKPFFYALDVLARIFGNFAFAILAFTVLVKLVLFPLAEKSGVSMAKMKKLAPKVTELREAYANDQQKMGQEMMALYKREGVNPLSGCWPILIQIPIFFALYKVLFISIEMRHVPFLWVPDLSAADPSNIFTLFGLLAWDAPSFLHLGIWPILMAALMALQMKMNPPPTDPAQKVMFGLMPWVFMVMMAAFPAGLVMYWAWSNFLSILQQYVIMRRLKVHLFD